MVTIVVEALKTVYVTGQWYSPSLFLNQCKWIKSFSSKGFPRWREDKHSFSGIRDYTCAWVDVILFDVWNDVLDVKHESIRGTDRFLEWIEWQAAAIEGENIIGLSTENEDEMEQEWEVIMTSPNTLSSLQQLLSLLLLSNRACPFGAVFCPLVVEEGLCGKINWSLRTWVFCC